MSIPSWTAVFAGNKVPVPQKGYSESIGANILRTPMDSGPGKLRFRGSMPQKLTVQFLMDTSQVTIFENFVLNTLKGVLRFQFPHPRTGSTVEVRILGQGQDLYTLTYVAPGYYNVGMQLEILP